MSSIRASRLLRTSAALLVAGALAACGAATNYPEAQPAPSERISRLEGDMITHAQIVALNPATMAELFDGHIAGVDIETIGGQNRLVIRGNIDPLIVVDNVPLPDPQELWSLEPHDVERIQILKDESAAAAYGPLAARGAVVITTRRK